MGGGSAGAVIWSRLSEDPSCRVAPIEAGDRPPEISSIPIACAAMQLDPATDWMYTGDQRVLEISCVTDLKDLLLRFRYRLQMSGRLLFSQLRNKCQKS